MEQEGGFLGGKKHKLNISSRLLAAFFIPSVPELEDTGAVFTSPSGQIISFEFLKVYFPTVVNEFEFDHFLPPCFHFKAIKCVLV